MKWSVDDVVIRFSLWSLETKDKESHIERPFLGDLNVIKYEHKCTRLTIKKWNLNFPGIKKNLRYHLVHPGGFLIALLDQQQWNPEVDMWEGPKLELVRLRCTLAFQTRVNSVLGLLKIDLLKSHFRENLFNNWTGRKTEMFWKQRQRYPTPAYVALLRTLNVCNDILSIWVCKFKESLLCCL